MSTVSTVEAERPNIDALSTEKKREIAHRLRIDLIGAGLLLVGAIWISWADAQIGYIIQAIAAMVVGFSVLYRGIPSIFSRTTDSYSVQIVSIAVLAAFAYGDFVTATLVPFALDLGRLFEERTALGVKQAISALQALQVQQVRLWKEDPITHMGSEERVSIEHIQVGAVLVVGVGEAIPTDGVVCFGESRVDQSAMTGEVKAQKVEEGSTVYAGGINLQGVIRIRVSAIKEQSALGIIISILESEKNTPKIVADIDLWLGRYFPFALSLSATVLFFTEDIRKAIAVLVVSYPSSLAIAGSATMISAFSKAASMGILVKNTSVFQQLQHTDVLVLDKTGTVTKGAESVQHVHVLGDRTEIDVWSIAGTCAQYSSHPISKIMTAYCLEQKIPLLNIEVERVEEIAGNGMVVYGKQGVYRLGRRQWLEAEGVGIATDLQGTGIAHNENILGFIEIADEIKAEAPMVLEQVRELGIETVCLLTGDGQQEAQRIATLLGIEYVQSQQLPQDKLQKVSTLQEQGYTVCMLGDGINDALALQQAHVGVAMGNAIHQVVAGGADVAILSDNIALFPKLVALADSVMRNIWQNIAIGCAFALLLLYVAIFRELSPIVAALLHNLGMVLVVINASMIWVRR